METNEANELNQPNALNETNEAEEIKSEELSENEAAEEPKDGKNPAQTPAQEVYDWLEVLVTAIVFVMVFFAFFARVTTVNGPSMTPTLLNGERLIVWELGYTPAQGDIIVCQSPYHGYEEPLVKRIIADEGQTVKIDFQNWKVYVDGEPLENEDYVNYIAGAAMNGWDYGESYTVPDGCVFVMGDNRNNSADSRRMGVGAIDKRLICGKVVFRLSPLDRFGSVA